MVGERARTRAGYCEAVPVVPATMTAMGSDAEARDGPWMVRWRECVPMSTREDVPLGQVVQSIEAIMMVMLQ